MRRGEIRTVLLATLTEGPGHGYDLMQRLEEKSGGAWRPSPGSVYPTLQLLEDEGLVRSTERDGKRVYELTATGRTEAASRVEEAGGAPWDLDGGSSAKRGREFAQSIKGVVVAFRQVAAAGDADQVDRATAIMNDTRKQLYAILAED
jgi:DNA-binding PadR family transcriptional regulator